MSEEDLEEVWNGRHTDDINDDWQRLAKRCTTWWQFLELAKQTIREKNNEE